MLAEGHPRIVAPWLGPTKIATAILYATITNIVAYLPFLMLTGTTGEFIYSLPVGLHVLLRLRGFLNSYIDAVILTI